MIYRSTNPSEKIAKEIPLELADVRDIEKITDLLCRSFKNYPLTELFSREAKNPRTVNRGFFHLWLEQSFQTSAVFRTSKAYEGVYIVCLAGFIQECLYMKMQNLNFYFRQFPITIALQILRFFRELNSKHEQIIKGRPHFYFELMGIDPSHQGKGYASKFFRPVIANADKNNKVCCLETESERNVEIYHHFGFEIVDTLSTNICETTCYLMHRDPE